MNRGAGDSRRELEAPAELESQFILRLPTEPARILRELIQSGANNLRDRLSIRIENDMRTGEVRLDHVLLHAKIVDFPTIVESLKTIDNKTFYKTADICQMLLCREDDDQTTTDEETPNKAKKKDPNKVDKKHLYPHGVTPPMKNVRKRRFRKTLKKKYVEAPEIEKEVKRLLRVDNEAVNVKWEVIYEDDDKSKLVSVKEEVEEHSISAKNIKTEVSEQSVDVAEQDIFGGAVSDSEEECNINVMEMDETGEDSRLSDPGNSTQDLVTEFSRDMFPRGGLVKQEAEDVDKFQVKRERESMSKESVKERMAVLDKEMEELKTRRLQQEQEVANIENMALRQRFQDILDNLLTEQLQKKHEYEELTRLLHKYT